MGNEEEIRYHTWDGKTTDILSGYGEYGILSGYGEYGAWAGSTPEENAAAGIGMSVDALQQSAAIRARIVAALTAEIGDAATAERLAGVVVRALEGE